MSYNKYAAAQIFQDDRANAICDFLFENLQNAFPPELDDKSNLWLFESCILSGKAAAILRGDTGTIGNITFEVDRDIIYNWIIANLGSKVFNCPQIAFKSRILLYPFPDLFFEIWWSDKDFLPVELDGIFIQNLESIPPQTL
jgi:hypothetical protein